MRPLHSWNLTPREAIELQRHLAEQITTGRTVESPRWIAGVDVSHNRKTGYSRAAAVIMSFPELEPSETAIEEQLTRFPYVPGLLSFRETPVVLDAFQKLSIEPDLVFVDGHGRAHPRRFGIACHLGLWLQLPTIGIGKSRLCGAFQEPSLERASRTDLVHQEEVIGQVLRTRRRVQPIFVSVGFGLPLGRCVEWTLKVSPRYRIPEPIRQADRLAGLVPEP